MDHVTKMELLCINDNLYPLVPFGTILEDCTLLRAVFRQHIFFFPFYIMEPLLLVMLASKNLKTMSVLKPMPVLKPMSVGLVCFLAADTGW